MKALVEDIESRVVAADTVGVDYNRVGLYPYSARVVFLGIFVLLPHLDFSVRKENNASDALRDTQRAVLNL